MSDPRRYRQATVPVSDWFTDWLRFHQKLHGSKFWVPYNHEDAGECYAGWILAFEQWGISRDQATHITKQLQQDPKAPPVQRQLGWVKDQFYKNLKAASQSKAVKTLDARDPAERAAASRSVGCPECSTPSGQSPGPSSGLASRFALDPRLPCPLPIGLYCRCEHGRFRSTRDPDGPDGGREYDDLRAHEWLWDLTVDHHTFDRDSPGDPPRPLANYMTPGESRARTAALADGSLASLAASALRDDRAPTGVPDGLTYHQEQFIFELGSMSKSFWRLPAPLVTSLLEAFRDACPPRDAEAVWNDLRMRRTPTPPPVPQHQPPAQDATQ